MWAQPVAGIGQGNGAGPTIWAAVSSLLFDIMKEDGFLAIVSCAMTFTKKSIGGFVFVDDMDLCVSSQPTAARMVIQLQNLVTHWEGLLQTKGVLWSWTNVFGI